jgi:uncharacterized protein (TIGR02246 family)
MSSDEDKAAIYREIDAFSQAWNQGDARVAASFFAEDGVRVGAFGDIQHGRAEVETALDRLLHGPMSGAKVTQERGTIRMLTSDLAVWQAGMQIAPGGNAPVMKGYVVQVMTKLGDRWLVLEAHPKFFPPRH